MLPAPLPLSPPPVEKTRVCMCVCVYVHCCVLCRSLFPSLALYMSKFFIFLLSIFPFRIASFCHALKNWVWRLVGLCIPDLLSVSPLHSLARLYKYKPFLILEWQAIKGALLNDSNRRFIKHNRKHIRPNAIRIICAHPFILHRERRRRRQHNDNNNIWNDAISSTNSIASSGWNSLLLRPDGCNGKPIHTNCRIFYHLNE